jgi:peroxiredoxin
MGAWGKDQNVDDKVIMLADGNAELADAMGLSFDAGGFGMGKRSQRYALVAENGVVKTLHVEKPGAFEVSSAETILNDL